jgi:hypothetical protein
VYTIFKYMHSLNNYTNSSEYLVNYVVFRKGVLSCNDTVSHVCYYLFNALLIYKRTARYTERYVAVTVGTFSVH